MATYRGTSGDDRLTVSLENLWRSRITLGWGEDTLAITGSGDATFSSDSYRRMSGVDVLDFTGWSSGALSVVLDRSIMWQTGTMDLAIVSGDTGIASLDAPASMGGTVTVAGSGVVQLADGVDNRVRIADASSVSVAGGTGDDTILASNDGSKLDGGEGDDTLVAGAGNDLVIAGAGNDLLVGFDPGQDTIEIGTTGLRSFADVLAASTQVGDGTLIDFGDGNSLTLAGLAPGDLVAADFSVSGIALDDGVIVVLPGTTAADLNAIIAAAPDGATILLADGVHHFTESIVIDRGHLTLKGQSEAGTVIVFDFPDGAATDGITVTGGERSYLGTLDGAVAAGDTSIVLLGNSLAAGDTIYMFQPNTREWLDANGWQNVSMEDADSRPFREVILQVSHVEGDTVHFTHAIPYAMDAGEVRLNHVELLEGLSFSDFTLTTPLGTADPYDFSNTRPGYEGTTAFSIVGTAGATLEHVSVLDSGSIAIGVGSSIDMAADDILVSGSNNKGGGGNGYGFLIFEANNNSFTNLEIYDTRHGFITSAWSAETDNFVHILETNRDVGFHGSPDRGNVVDVDRAVLDFDVPFYGNGGSGWTVVSGSGSNHAAIDPYAENTITFDYVEGVNRNDVAHAGDGGVYMNGKYGYDTLIGGAGEDYLVGGTLADTLTGGGGHDTFLFRVGDGLDRVTDMTFGTDGDTMIFAGNPAVTSFDDLVFYELDGELRVRYGSNATVILEGVDLADVQPGNFAFDPDGTGTQLAYYGSDVPLA